MAEYIYPADLSGINQAYQNGILQVMPYRFYEQFKRNTIAYFMYTNGIYVLPTTELIDFIRQHIVGSAIEIGSGHGAIARTLGIPITDSKLQERPDIAAHYSQVMKQPPIKYPDDVEELSAHRAINLYQPDTVIGAFISHKYSAKTKDGNMYGVEEEKIFDIATRYINIGNEQTHRNKPIGVMSFIHKRNLDFHGYGFPWIITRAEHQDLNRIWIWTDKARYNRLTQKVPNKFKPIY